ncbi:MAG: hypothetical protein HY854_20570 [Burkholderiales bacterium]|nr:hypothetical protein [Burkholderiales bacterium]
MVASYLSRVIELLPRRLRESLDAWSQRVAQRRAQARRRRGERRVVPLPPVVIGRAYLPHPWRD